MRFAVLVVAACVGSVTALSLADLPVEMDDKENSSFVEEKVQEIDFKEIAQRAAARGLAIRNKLNELLNGGDRSLAETSRLGGNCYRKQGVCEQNTDCNGNNRCKSNGSGSYCCNITHTPEPEDPRFETRTPSPSTNDCKTGVPLKYIGKRNQGPIGIDKKDCMKRCNEAPGDTPFVCVQTAEKTKHKKIPQYCCMPKPATTN